MHPVQSWDSPTPVRNCRRVLGIFCLTGGLLGSFARADEVEAVSAKVANGYVRKHLPDGTVQPETYAFGKGDNWSGARVDSTIDQLDFLAVARTVALPLAEQKYLPTRDPQTTTLLIMVYWGTTRAPENSSESSTLQRAQQIDRQQDQATLMLKDAQTASEKKVGREMVASSNQDMLAAVEAIASEDQLREDRDRKTATLLGYDSEWIATETGNSGSVIRVRKDDMLNELEEDRYFVVLMAYDFQAMSRHKKNRLLWETHISIREHANAFDERLAGMLGKAGAYFGTDSHGLRHEYLPQGHVEVGSVKSLGVVDGK